MTQHELPDDKPDEYQPQKPDDIFSWNHEAPPRPITIHTGNHKERIVYEPSEETRKQHEEILKALYGLRLSPIATAVQSGSRIINNVLPHVGNLDFYLLDIVDAFPSVDIEGLKEIAYGLLSEQLSKDDAKRLDTFIDTWATIPGVSGLPLGYPCSPLLFEIASQPLDAKLQELQQKNSSKNLVVTRYLDDISFSSQNGGLTSAPRRIIREAIESFSGYEINTQKSRVQSLGRGAVVITGIALNPDGRLTPAPRLLAQVEEGIWAFEDILESGVPITAHDLGVLHGLNSILHMTGNPERSATKSVRQLARRVKELTETARTR